MTMERMTWEEARKHAGQMLDKWSALDAAEAILPHYLFTVGDEKHREGWCSACKRWVDASPEAIRQRAPGWVMDDPYMDDGYEEPQYIPQPEGRWWSKDRHTGRTGHRDHGWCPNCGEKVEFRGLWRGHKGLIDRRFLIRYGKSRIQPDTLVCVGYDVTAAWRYMDPNEPDVPVSIEPLEVCVFPYGGKAERFLLKRTWCDMGGWDERWTRMSQCKSGWSPGVTYGNGVLQILDNRSLMEAVQETRFAPVIKSGHAVWNTESAKWYDRIELLARICKYPCVEYLYKLDMDEIANACVEGAIGRRIDPKGKTAAQVLRLRPEDWGEVKGKKLSLTPDALDVYRMARARKWRANMELIAWCGHGYGWAEKVRQIADAFQPAVKMLRYCKRRGVSLRDYADHVDMMRRLGMTETDTEFLYPRDFASCHSELAIRIAETANAEKDAKIAERIEKGEMDAYFFSAAGLTMRPAFSAAELVTEGAALAHCVARYADNHTSGACTICFLRDDTAVTKPRYTVEFSKDGRLIQCRGYGNDVKDKAKRQKMADEDRLELFWRLFEMHRAALKIQKKKERKAA